MPGFYFHTKNAAERTVQDDEGVEFASVHDAKRYAGGLLRDVAEHLWR